MAMSQSHKRAQQKAAGKKGKTEVPLPGNRRLDAETQSGNRATEVERSGNTAQLEKAANRLQASGAPQKVLQVPQSDMPKAAAAMRATKVKGTVRNIAGTKRLSVS